MGVVEYTPLNSDSAKHEMTTHKSAKQRETSQSNFAATARQHAAAVAAYEPLIIFIHDASS